MFDNLLIALVDRWFNELIILIVYTKIFDKIRCLQKKMIDKNMGIFYYLFEYLFI